MTTALTTRITAGTGATVKNLPLSSTEIDNNFLSLNDNKIETSEAVTTNTAGKVVKRDGSGGFSAGDVSLGAITATSITISGGTGIPTTSGGTGAVTYTNGQLLIGNSSGSLTKATLTGTSNQIIVTNSSGGITLSTPQDLGTSSNVQHAAIGVGVSNSTAGSAYLNNSLGVGTAPSGTAGEIRATNTITSWYSDERLKTNIELIPNALNKVMTLRGVTFTANEIAESFGYTNKEQQVGVLASDVEKVLPEAVKPAPFDIMILSEGIEISRSGENYKTVQYEKLVPLLIEAIKQLKTELDEIKGTK